MSLNMRARIFINFKILGYHAQKKPSIIIYDEPSTPSSKAFGAILVLALLTTKEIQADYSK